MESMLMGDIIGSKKYSVNQLATVMEDFLSYISEQNKDLLVGSLVPKVGDEYQCLCYDARSSMRLVFEIDEYFLIKNLDIRSRFVLVQDEFAGNSKSPYGRYSEELYYAHESLSRKTNDRKYVNLQYSRIVKRKYIEDLFFVLNEIRSSWKVKDFPLISLFLMEKNIQKLSEKLGHTKQQMERKHKRLKIENYEKLKDCIINLIEEES